MGKSIGSFGVRSANALQSCFEAKGEGRNVADRFMIRGTDMQPSNLEQCPDCKVWLPTVAGQGHRYVGASPSCWACFSALVNAGEPPLAPHPHNALLLDAYMVQHPGQPSPPAIQSVAVHLLALYGVLVRGVAPEQVLWIRQRAVRGDAPARHARFAWLTPPDFTGSPTVAGIAAGVTPQARTESTIAYIRTISKLWTQSHQTTIANWYARYVEGSRPT